MPYSTGCSTPLSNFEAGQNYKDVSGGWVAAPGAVRGAESMAIARCCRGAAWVGVCAAGFGWMPGLISAHCLPPSLPPCPPRPGGDCVVPARRRRRRRTLGGVDHHTLDTALQPGVVRPRRLGLRQSAGPGCAPRGRHACMCVCVCACVWRSGCPAWHRAWLGTACGHGRWAWPCAAPAARTVSAKGPRTEPCVCSPHPAPPRTCSHGQGVYCDGVAAGRDPGGRAQGEEGQEGRRRRAGAQGL